MGLRSGRRSFGLRLEGNLVFGTALVIPSYYNRFRVKAR